jgi:hypothetical protein
LVNIQTLLWARTGTARSLGQVMVVGQPVWLKIVFDHAAWDFGDGVRASSAVPGKAYDDVGDRCAQVLCPDYYGHVYRSAGPVRGRRRCGCPHVAHSAVEMLIIQRSQIASFSCSEPLALPGCRP